MSILRKGLLERPQEDVSEPPYLLAVLIKDGRQEKEGLLQGVGIHASYGERYIVKASC